MWYDKLIQNNSLKQLYKDVPALTDVEINQISLKRDGAEVSIIFELPVYPDNPPAKWNDCNTVSVEISFFVIRLRIGTKGRLYARGYRHFFPRW